MIVGQNIESTKHWIKQRISSILLIPLTMLFVYNFLDVSTLSYNEVIENYKNPFNLIIAFLFITISIWHFYQGIEVVLEDYIHDLDLRNYSLKTLKYLCWILAIGTMIAFSNLYRLGI
ncbi:MAG: succinate dehydrogenase, hydrophobic membrane anchor protein [Paracoccaceae bacterium]